MKLLRATKGNFQFHLGQREKQVFCEILELYPCIPPAHQPLSKNGKPPQRDANQRLLDEALAEQRADNQKQLSVFLSDPLRLVPVKKQSDGGFRLSLSPVEIEWLLQILNDIRVGSWIKLGSPEEPKLALNANTMAQLWAMEASGHFQMQLLAAVSGNDAPSFTL